MFRNYDMESFLQKNKALLYAFIASLISYCFVYGFELTHFTLSVDEESVNNFRQTLSLGRWGHALLHAYFLPEPYVPFFSMTISIIILSISSSVICLYLKLDRITSICFGILIAALPQLAYQLQFNNQADTVSLALLLSSLSVLALNDINRWKSIVFITLTVSSLSIYQSVFFYAISIYLLNSVLDSTRSDFSIRGFLKKSFLVATLICASVVINALLAKFMASMYGITITGYLSSMIGWKSQGFITVLGNLKYFTSQFFSFNASYGLNLFSLLPVFFIIFSIALVVQKKPLLIPIASILIAITSAFLLNIIIGGALPARAMTQIPIVFAGVLVLTIKVTGLRRTGLMLSILFLMVGASSSNRLFYSDYMARESDEFTAKQIIDTIYDKYPDFDPSKNKVFFYGFYTPLNVWRLPNSETFGASFFSWDSAKNWRIRNYIKSIGLEDIRILEEDEIKTLFPVAETMKSWPNREAIFMQNGVVVVKLGEKMNAYYN